MVDRGQTRDTGRGAESARRGGIFGLRWVSVVALALALGLTAGAVILTRSVVANQDSRLLKERANEVGLVFDSAISSLPTSLASLGEVARDGGTPLFKKEAAAVVTGGTGATAVALLRKGPSGYVVTAVAGKGLTLGQTISGGTATFLAEAQKSSVMLATPVMGTGAGRTLGFALGGSAVPPGTVVYRLTALGPVQPPQEAATAPFRELRVVLYASPTPQPSQVLVTTTADLPLHGSVDRQRITAGGTTWLLGVSAVRPLVGSFAAFVPWLVLIVGIAGSILITLVLEQVARRRDTALALYKSERNVAETLQRKLLPTLPLLAGLDIASRYVAASDGQEVGGDWFDAFDLGGGRAAVVIGDVIGHDIEAAAAMAQIRASLRAYAWKGGEPSAVVEQLSQLVEAFNIAGLVSLIYCVLEPPDRSGARGLKWANAGHLPPFVRMPHEQVHELSGGSSRVIGAPGGEARQQGYLLLPPGSTLVLYTDGLIEIPGAALDDSIQRLRSALDVLDTDTGANDVCESILHSVAGDTTRDDIAIVVARILNGVAVSGDAVPGEAATAENTPAAISNR